MNLAYTLGWYEADFDGSLANLFPFRSSYSMQRTSGDERHRLVLSEVSAIPFGFTLSTIATVASPRPAATTLGQDTTNNNVFTDDFIDGSRTIRPSNSWRNWYRTVDLRLARPIFTARGRKLSTSLEVFNLFNSNNVATFDSRQFPATAGAAQLGNFMQPISAFAARQAQLGVCADF